jgi:protein-L-isoaspartate(D-aspartate) O-methyltransferase
MAVMLNALDITDGHRVLEIGTGTGYNAALLAHRIGSPLVTSVDIDAGLIQQARRALTSVGYAPTVAVADGAAGYPDRAPYDRLIATCSVPTVPMTWLAQMRPGGVILTNLHRDIGGGVLLRLTVDEHGEASGHLLDDFGSFMPLRSCPTTQTSALIRAASSQIGETNETQLATPLTDEGDAWTALVALLMPDVARLDIDRPDGAVQWLVHPDGSWSYHEITTNVVEQGGPRRLWTQVEDLYSRWLANGKPDRTHIGVTINATGQRVWLNEPDETID